MGSVPEMHNDMSARIPMSVAFSRPRDSSRVRTES